MAQHAPSTATPIAPQSPVWPRAPMWTFLLVAWLALFAAGVVAGGKAGHSQLSLATASVDAMGGRPGRVHREHGGRRAEAGPAPVMNDPSHPRNPT